MTEKAKYLFWGELNKQTNSISYISVYIISAYKSILNNIYIINLINI